MQYINSERFEKLCRHHRVIVFLSVGVNDISENIYDRTERELTKVYERVIRKYQQVDQGIKSINRHIKLIIATIPPKDLIQTLLKYPHKSEKIETITRDHQTSYENFVCRINEEFINMFKVPLAIYLTKNKNTILLIIKSFKLVKTFKKRNKIGFSARITI